MALYNLHDLFSLLHPEQRLLGLDPGGKRIGVALSDVNRRVASPFGTLLRTKMKFNAVEIAAIAEQEDVGGLIIGLPLDEDQKLGPRAQAARDWAHGISAATGLPVAMVDESYSTSQTHERLIEAGVSRARRAEIVDKLAAAEILQRALDAARH